jgi:hypothetical protein
MNLFFFLDSSLVECDTPAGRPGTNVSGVNQLERVWVMALLHGSLSGDIFLTTVLNKCHCHINVLGREHGVTNGQEAK